MNIKINNYTNLNSYGKSINKRDKNLDKNKQVTIRRKRRKEEKQKRDTIKEVRLLEGNCKENHF